MVIHYTECPYGDQLSLNNTNQTILCSYRLQHLIVYWVTAYKCQKQVLQSILIKQVIVYLSVCLSVCLFVYLFGYGRPNRKA